jgi:hypothetical protein
MHHLTNLVTLALKILKKWCLGSMMPVLGYQIEFSVQSVSVIYYTREMLQENYEEDDYDDNDDIIEETIDHGWHGVGIGNKKYKFEIDSVITYAYGYGYDVDAFGATGNHVDSGMNTFINHGCNKTFNFSNS